MLTHDLAVYIVLFSIIGFMISHIILMYKVEKLQKEVKYYKMLLNGLYSINAVNDYVKTYSEVADNDNNKS